MRVSRVAPFVALLAFLFCLLPTGRLAAGNPVRAARSSDAALLASYHGTADADADARAVRPRADGKAGGIREVVPEKYAARYQQWKEEFLSTETGRRQWTAFEQDPQFTLTVVVSQENAHGGGTGKYRWDDSGKLVAATITLGSRMDEGYPNPIYFPVMNSLMPYASSHAVSGEVLAAAKIAHEFGHLIRTSQTDTALYQLQGQLIPVYNKILLSNGRDAGDARLVELARRMGGTPVEIWEDREYWGETNAMRYLRDRFTDEDLRCSLFNKIRQSVDLYAKSYGERFIQVAQSAPAPGRCGWK